MENTKEISMPLDWEHQHALRLGKPLVKSAWLWSGQVSMSLDREDQHVLRLLKSPRKTACLWTGKFSMSWGKEKQCLLSLFWQVFHKIPSLKWFFMVWSKNSRNHDFGDFDALWWSQSKVEVFLWLLLSVMTKKPQNQQNIQKWGKSPKSWF